MSLKPKSKKAKAKSRPVTRIRKVTNKSYRKSYSDKEPVLIGKDTEPFNHRTSFKEGKLFHSIYGKGPRLRAENAAYEHAAYIRSLGFIPKVVKQDGAYHVFRRRDISDLIHQ